MKVGKVGWLEVTFNEIDDDGNDMVGEQVVEVVMPNAHLKCIARNDDDLFDVIGWMIDHAELCYHDDDQRSRFPSKPEGPIEALCRLVDEAGLKWTFGLTPEKRAVVTQRLAEGVAWADIGREVGWEPETLQQWYEAGSGSKE